MLQSKVIGPGRNGNYLAVYRRPGSREWCVIADCNTECQAIDAKSTFDKEQAARQTAAQLEVQHRRGIRGFYSDEDAA